MREKKRTGEIYCVTVNLVGHMNVEAGSPEEAMKIAEKYCNEVDNDVFWDSDVYVDSCDSYPTDLEDIEDTVWLADGRELTCEEYMDELADEEGGAQ